MKIKLSLTLALLVLLTPAVFCEPESRSSPSIKTFVKKVVGGGRLVQAIQGENDTYISVSRQRERDYLVRKTSSTGEKVWERKLRFEVPIYIEGIAQTPDGGFILVGWQLICIRNCDDLLGYAVLHNEGHLVKLKSDGVVEWSKAYSATNRGSANFTSIVSDSDGGFTVVDYPGQRIVKFTSGGDVVWTKTFTYPPTFPYIVAFYEMGRSLDNGYILVSYNSNPEGGADVIKLNNLGTILWKKSLRVEGLWFRTALFTADDGVLLAFMEPHCNKVSLVALQRDGSVSWKATYSYDTCSISDLMKTPDGGYIILSYGSLLKIDSSHKVVFNTTRGVSAVFVFNSEDGGILIFDQNMEISKLDSKIGDGCRTTPVSASKLPQTPLKTGIPNIREIVDPVIWGIKKTKVTSNDTNLPLITVCQ